MNARESERSGQCRARRLEMVILLRLCSSDLGTGRSSGGNSNALLPSRSVSRSSLSRPAFLRSTGLVAFSMFASGRSLSRCLRDLRLRHLECALTCLVEPLFLPSSSHDNQYHNTNEEPDTKGWKSIDEWGHRKGVE